MRSIVRKSILAIVIDLLVFRNRLRFVGNVLVNGRSAKSLTAKSLSLARMVFDITRSAEENGKHVVAVVFVVALAVARIMPPQKRS